MTRQELKSLRQVQLVDKLIWAEQQLESLLRAAEASEFATPDKQRSFYRFVIGYIKGPSVFKESA